MLLFSGIILIVMFVMLILEKIDPIKILIVTISVFLVMGQINIEDVTIGLTNRGVLSIAALYIIAGAVERSSIFNALTSFENVNHKSFKSYKFFPLVSVLSAFLYNAPLVSIFIPITNRIAKKIKKPISKLLIPLSYVALLGGTLTLIGSSTNLISSGVIESYGFQGIGFWELTLLALPSVVLGLIYVILLYNKSLPDTSMRLSQSRTEIKNHMIRFVVSKESDIIGKNMYEANLRNLESVYLSDIERDKILLKVTRELTFQAEDVLIFTGQTNKLDDLRKFTGLKLESDYQMDTNYFDNEQTLIMEVVVTQNVAQFAQSIKKMKFRDQYNAVVIGVIREGKQLTEKIGNIVLKLGDTLLLIVDRDDRNRITDNFSFTVINQENRTVHHHNFKSYVPIVVLFGTILTSALFNIHILSVALIGIALLFVTNVISPKDALKSINFKTIALLVLSIAIGSILVKTGITSFIGDSVMHLVADMNPLGLLAIIFVIISLFTLVLSNNAVIVIIIPIVISIISVTSYDLRPFLLVATIAASATYLSPYSYQTNIMVYGAGGYYYRDFIKFGLPLLFIVMMSTIFTAYILFFM